MRYGILNEEFFINEWGSVSDDVIKIVDFIISILIEDIKKQEKKLSNITRTIYYENNIELSIPKLLFNNKIEQDKNIELKYVLYNINTEDEAKVLINNIGADANCSWDEKEQTLDIVSFIIKDKPLNDLSECIYHEVEHMYQYAIGMERSDIYKKMRNLLNRGYDDIDGYYVGLALYYTFKHEQDAFTQQFYKWLWNNNIDNTDNSNILSNCQAYNYACKAWDVIKNNENNPYIQSAINYLGYNKRDYKKRVKFGLRRFEQKLRNALNRYRIEYNDKHFTNEIKMKQVMSFMSKTTILSEDNKVILKRIPIDMEYFYKIFYK